MSPGPHYQGDVLSVLDWGWDLMIAHPECIFLCGSGMHWTTRGLRDQKLTDDAAAFALKLWNANIKKIAMENPVGILSSLIRKPDQYIQPYDFGEDASKKTCLWLKNLPPLVPTNRVPGRMVLHKGKLVERWANQTDSGQNKLGPSETRSLERSLTYQGWADAMGEQWGAP